MAEPEWTKDVIDGQADLWQEQMHTVSWAPRRALDHEGRAEIGTKRRPTEYWLPQLAARRRGRTQTLSRSADRSHCLPDSSRQPPAASYMGHARVRIRANGGFARP